MGVPTVAVSPDEESVKTGKSAPKERTGANLLLYGLASRTLV